MRALLKSSDLIPFLRPALTPAIRYGAGLSKPEPLVNIGRVVHSSQTTTNMYKVSVLAEAQILWLWRIS